MSEGLGKLRPYITKRIILYERIKTKIRGILGLHPRRERDTGKLGENKNSMFTEGEDLIETNATETGQDALNSSEDLEENNKFTEKREIGQRTQDGKHLHRGKDNDAFIKRCHSETKTEYDGNR